MTLADVMPTWKSMMLGQNQNGMFAFTMGEKKELERLKRYKRKISTCCANEWWMRGPGEKTTLSACELSPLLTDIPGPLPQIPYTLTRRAHCSAGGKARDARHMQHSALHSSVRTTKHPGGERGWWRAHKRESTAHRRKGILCVGDSHADHGGLHAVAAADRPCNGQVR